MSKFNNQIIPRIIKILIFLFLEVIIFYNISKNFGGISLPDMDTALIILVLLSIINAVIWPTLSYISLRFIVFTLGLGTFLIDGILLYAISMIIPGVSIEGFALFSVPLLIALINSLLSMILGFDLDNNYYQNNLKKELLPDEKIEKPGYIFLEIDGLAHDILLEAIQQDKMPFLKSLLDDDSHKLIKWETDLSSQTSSSQAGILHGNNSNIPAFRWVEKENDNIIISSNGLHDAVNIEKRISDGHGLLSIRGASRSNLFSGDAEDYILTYSKFTKFSEFYTKTWYYLYSYPYIISRILILFIADMILELFSRIIKVIKCVKPRIKRGLSYFVSRSGANVVMREATTFTIIGDIYAAKSDVIYATYMGYDEIAHHSGIRDFDSFYALKGIDSQFERLYNATLDSKRDYNLIVLSDHGQSGGPTFKQKYGLTLNDLVMRYLPENIIVHSILHSNDDHFADNFRITSSKEDKVQKNIPDDNSSYHGIIDEIREKREILKQKDPIMDRLQRISDKYDIGIAFSKEEVVSKKSAQAIVLASGNLGLIYFTDWKNRLTYEQIEDAFPGLLKGLASHEGIGFVMVKSSILGTMILSDDNVYYMDSDTYVGDEFLNVYGKNIVSHLKRTDSFDHVPDILVNSTYDSESGEVYAFEELIGSHGGVGGTQQEPFIICPESWTLDEDLVGAENVHKFFKREIRKGMDDN